MTDTGNERSARRRRSIDDEFHAPLHWRITGRSAAVGIVALSILILAQRYSWWWPLTVISVVACVAGDIGTTRANTLRRVTPYMALTIAGMIGGLGSLVLLAM